MEAAAVRPSVQVGGPPPGQRASDPGPPSQQSQPPPPTLAYQQRITSGASPIHSNFEQDEEVDVCDLTTPLKTDPDQNVNYQHDICDGKEYSSESLSQPSVLEPMKGLVTYEIVELSSSPVNPAPPTVATKKGKKRRHQDDPVEREFIRVLHETGDQMRSKPENTSSTRKLLDSLATKIEDAQLPLNVLNRLEVDLMRLVHTALENNLESG